MKAEIISVGTEILLGEILDTNSNFIASRLPSLGIDLYLISQVGDNLQRLTEAIRKGMERADVLLLSGGLGPTEDDVTREAIAAALDEEPRLDGESERHLREFFAGRGLPLPERNLKQATLIPSARSIPNPMGTAPGWWVEKEGKTIVAIPGPPHEMRNMWENEVEPRLSCLSGQTVIVSHTLKTIGMGEGQLDETISPLLASTNPTLGVYSRMDGVQVRLTAKASSRVEAAALIAPLEAEVRKRLGDVVWGVDEETLEVVVGRMLSARGHSLATMESCTGGLLASTITDVSGSSGYFRGGYVAYTSEMKTALGVQAGLIEQHGVVSAEVAVDMARACREALMADYGIGVTGVVGPDELEGKAPGTIYIAVHDGHAPLGSNHIVYHHTIYHGRLATKRRAVTSALALLRRALMARV